MTLNSPPRSRPKPLRFVDPCQIEFDCKYWVSGPTSDIGRIGLEALCEMSEKNELYVVWDDITAQEVLKGRFATL